MIEKSVLLQLEKVAEATRTETIQVGDIRMSPLLAKTAEELLTYWRSGLSAMAVSSEGEVLGHAALEPLAPAWFELGAVWVREDCRGAGGYYKRVANALYRVLLAANTEKNILATTINPAALGLGRRIGLVPISYESLPSEIWNATCCCPAEKTGVPRGENVPGCQLKEKLCFVRVTQETWERLGRPQVIQLPGLAPAHEAETVPESHNFQIVLSRMS